MRGFGYRRGRRVRVHLDGTQVSVEGVMVGRRPVAGHYMVLTPRALEDEGRSASISGHIEVPASRVLFVQVLESD